MTNRTEKPDTSIAHLADQTANTIVQAIADAYNTGYQAAEANERNMTQAGVEPPGPYKPSISLDQMQDGKRYRVTVEGVYREIEGSTRDGIKGKVSWMETERHKLENLISHATRIEEIR